MGVRSRELCRWWMEVAGSGGGPKQTTVKSEVCATANGEEIDDTVDKWIC